MSSSTAESFVLTPDVWLGTLLGREAFRVALDKTQADPSALARLARDWRSKPVFAYAKVSTQHVIGAQALEAAGFHLVDTRIGFDKPRSASPGDRPVITVRLAKPEDEQAVSDLAGRCFSLSRFHLDPVIPPALANKIKAEWVRNYFKGQRGDQMVVAEDQGRTVGFVQLLSAADNTVIIDLIGVDAGHRGRGIAADMMRAAEAAFPQAKRVKVGTQAANAPSLRLYERYGFRFEESEYIFHFHGTKEWR